MPHSHSKIKKLQHHGSLISLSLLFAIFILTIRTCSHIHDVERSKALTAAEARVSSLRDNALAAKARYDTDYANEGFFKRHLWSDSTLVKADMDVLNNAEQQYEQAQQRICNLNTDPKCNIQVIQPRSWIETFWHRIKVLVIIAIACLLAEPIIIVIAEGAYLVMGLSYYAAPFIIIAIAVWYFFH